MKNAGKSLFTDPVIDDTGASIPILYNDQESCTSLFIPLFPAAGGEEEIQHKTDEDTFETFTSSLLFEQVPETI